MKGLILAAGKGTRLRPLTYTTPKPLLPICNKPTIQFAIEAVRDCGIEEIGIVVGDQGDQIAEALGSGSQFGVRLSYLPQGVPHGLAHAVMCAGEFIAHDSFMLFLGDTLVDSSFESFRRSFDETGADSLLLVAPVEHPQRFGIVELNGDRVVHMEEKPKEPRSNLALTGIYFFGPRLWDVLPDLKPSARGELEITDAAHMMLTRGFDVRAVPYEGWWHDSGTPDYMLLANDYLLKRITPALSAELPPGCRLDGPVVMGRGVQVTGSVKLIGPCIIGDGCVLEECTIGPNVCLSDGVHITGSSIGRSIVLEHAHILHWPRVIKNTLVGKRAKLSGGAGDSIYADDSPVHFG